MLRPPSNISVVDLIVDVAKLPVKGNREEVFNDVFSNPL
jgi:hypothetical protein